MRILETIDTPVGGYAPDFELPGIDGQVHHLSRYRQDFGAVSVISMCNHCPYVSFYLERLKAIQEEFSSQGLILIGINSNGIEQDAAECFNNMRIFAQKHKLNFPYLWDSTQDVSRSFGSQITPMAFLIDGSGIVRYKGQIDDSPHDATAVNQNYLRNAIASLFNNQKIEIPETQPAGTSLIWRN
jgi:peroxiredoxin